MGAGQGLQDLPDGHTERRDESGRTWEGCSSARKREDAADGLSFYGWLSRAPRAGAVRECMPAASATDSPVMATAAAPAAVLRHP